MDAGWRCSGRVHGQERDRLSCLDGFKPRIGVSWSEGEMKSYHCSMNEHLSEDPPLFDEGRR